MVKKNKIPIEYEMSQEECVHDGDTSFIYRSGAECCRKCGFIIRKGEYAEFMKVIEKKSKLKND